jgi:hypothetical protein
MSVQSFVKNSTFLTKILLAALLFGVIWGSAKAYKKFFPEHVKNTEIVTKATSLPPLAYDKGSNAPLRALPAFDEPAGVQAPEVRGLPFGWNGFSAASYSVGGKHTSKGSIAEELGLNISLDVNNSTTEQLNQLMAFADAYHGGDHNPTKGVHFIILMGDAWFRYGAGFNASLRKQYGPDYNAKVYTFTGASFGEDKWQIDDKFRKDPRGSLTATVIGDGD